VTPTTSCGGINAKFGGSACGHNLEVSRLPLHCSKYMEPLPANGSPCALWSDICWLTGLAQPRHTLEGPAYLEDKPILPWRNWPHEHCVKHLIVLF